MGKSENDILEFLEYSTSVLQLLFWLSLITESEMLE